MKINLSPQRRDDSLPTIRLTGSILAIGDDELDLNDIPEGSTYSDAQGLSPWLTGTIDRTGDTEITMLLPHGPNPEQWQAFPEPIFITQDGQVDLPFNTYVITDNEYIEPSEEYQFGAVKTTTTIIRWHQPHEIHENIVPIVIGESSL